MASRLCSPKGKGKGNFTNGMGILLGEEKRFFGSYYQNINKTRYDRLLRRHPFPVIYQMNSIGMPLEDSLFQQDNAPVCKA